MNALRVLQMLGIAVLLLLPTAVVPETTENTRSAFSLVNLTITASKSTYYIGEEVVIIGNLTINSASLSGCLVAIEVLDPSNNSLMCRARLTDGEGMYNLTFRLPYRAPSGTYRALASSAFKGETVTSSTVFEVVARIDTPIKGGESATIEGNVTLTRIVVAKNTLHIEASGPKGSIGWMNVIFPMINTTDIKVFINGTRLSPPPFPIITSNGTHYFIYLEFTLSTEIISIQFWLLGDITGLDGEQDCKVDIVDLTAVASAYGSYPDHPHWNPIADLTGLMYLVPDNIVDVRDLAIIGRNYGRTYP